jgi:hypothetical protein
MRLKYLPLILSLLFSLSVIFSAAYAYWRLEQPRQVVQIKLPKAPNIPRVKPTVIADLAQLEPRLARLVTPKAPPRGPANLMAFGYQRVARTYPIMDAPKVELPSHYSLSMTFVSSKRRYCVIDGRFYRQGETLPEGPRVEKVQPEGVLLSWRNVSHWLQKGVGMETATLDSGQLSQSWTENPAENRL